MGSASTRTTGAIAAGARPACCCIALAVSDATAAQVIGADLNQHLVASQKLDSELCELAGCPAEALVACRLLEGDQVKPVALLLLDHAGGLDHALLPSKSRTAPLTVVRALKQLGSSLAQIKKAETPMSLPPLSMDLGLLLISIGVVNLWRARQAS